MIDGAVSALTAMMTQLGGLDSRVLDVVFAAPTRRMLDGLQRPALLFSLFDIRENGDLRGAHPMTLTRGDRAAVRKMPPRRIELCYLVAAIAAEPADEQLILARAVATLLRYSDLPVEILPPHFVAADVPVSGRLIDAKDPGPRPLDVWQAQAGAGASSHGDARPGVVYALTVPVDLEISLSSPLVLSRELRLFPPQVSIGGDPPGFDPAASDRSERGVRSSFLIAGRVFGPDGQVISGAAVSVVGRALLPSCTDTAGRFTLQELAAGNVKLRVQPPIDSGTNARNGSGAAPLAPAEFDFTIPSSSYDMTLSAMPSKAKKELR